MKKIGPKIFLSNKMFVVLNIVGKKKIRSKLISSKKKISQEKFWLQFQRNCIKKVKMKDIFVKKVFWSAKF